MPDSGHIESAIPGAFINNNRQLEGFQVTEEEENKMVERMKSIKFKTGLSYDNIIAIFQLLEKKRENDQNLWDGDARDEAILEIVKTLKELVSALESRNF